MKSRVVVTGANGFVGSHTCEELVARGASVRAVVRREGTAPTLDGVDEFVGDFYDPDLAAKVTDGADAVVATVHLRPYIDDLPTQRAVGVDGTLALARAARDAGVDRFVYISTVTVYDPPADAGDLSDTSPIPDSTGDYPMTKQEAEAGLAEIDGMTRIILRPPSILGPGPTSMWNTEVPTAILNDENARQWNPDAAFPWTHVTDFAAIVAAAATDLPTAERPDEGPIESGVTAANVASGTVTFRDYITAVTDVLGVEPIWATASAWSGAYLAERARGWGWQPNVGYDQAISELVDGLRKINGTEGS